MTRLRVTAATTFRSLRVRNYRLYFTGQLISVSGTWMQGVAQAWLVVRQPHGLAPPSRAGVDLGIVTALQFLPMLLFGTWGGLIADRFDKRHVLYGTQAAAGVLALALGLLTSTGTVRLWHVELLATLLGFVNLVDNPARQTFVLEMVGPDDLPNAVGLNSVLMNASRIIGPALGGVLIATVGLAPCFEVNAASYVAVIVALAMMRHGELFPVERVARARGQLRQGLAYVWRTPVLRDTLLLVAVVGTLAYNFQVVLALLARMTFHGNAGTYSWLLSLMAVGSVVGGLVFANRGRPGLRSLTAIGVVFGVLIGLVAACPSFVPAAVAVVPMGAASLPFIATANSTLQLNAEQTMRGRVMALYAMAFLGTTPIGSLLVGWISQVASPRVALLLGGVATVVASLATRARHHRTRQVPVEVVGALDEQHPGSTLGVA